MKRMKLGLLFQDEGFSESFAYSMSEWFDVRILADDEREGIDVLMTDFLDQDADLYLVWDRASADETHLYAFEGAEYMRKMINFAYGKIHQDYKLILTSSNLSLSCVCSSGGGLGCTTFSRALAFSLNGRNLMISLDDLPYEDENMKNAPFDINRYLFELKNGNAVPELVTYEDVYGVNCLRYHAPYNFLNMVSHEDLLLLLRSFCSFFDHIILDMGCRVDENARFLMQLCDRMYFMETADAWRNERYEAIVREQFQGEIMRIQKFFGENNQNVKSAGISMKKQKEIWENICQQIAKIA